MRLNTEHIIGKGGYSDVFSIDERVYKLFISGAHPRCNQHGRGPLEDELRTNQFNSEFDAWEIASKSSRLVACVPRFYGRVKIDLVEDKNQRNLSNNYLLDCCLSIERIRLDDVKFDIIKSRFPWIEATFRQEGINHTRDMSAFLLDNGNKIKLIDFAVEDAYFNTELTWIASGKLI